VAEISSPLVSQRTVRFIMIKISFRRFFRMWAWIDGVETVENMPRCMSNNYSLQVRLLTDGHFMYTANITITTVNLFTIYGRSFGESGMPLSISGW
jgi:hypothetical protein